jgi:hypothetical protein
MSGIAAIETVGFVCRRVHGGKIITRLARVKDALGHKRTSPYSRAMSALPDTKVGGRRVGYGPTTDLWHREHRNSHTERSKYLAGVLPSDRRNIAMKALVL